jgi:hypothetical protein
MKQVTVNIPEGKMNSFLELVKGLGGSEAETADDMVIPEWQKEIVRDRIKKSDQDPSRLMDWDTVKGDFKFD